jgi:hypothetical protein
VLCLFACTHAAPRPDPTPSGAATAPPAAPSSQPPSFAGIEAPSSAPATGRLAVDHFPGMLVGLPRIEIIDYEAKGHAGLGYSVSYGSRESLIVTLYVYDMGESDIPDGPSSPQVQEQLRRAVGDIFQAERMSLYQNVQKAREATITLGSGAPGPRVTASGVVFYLDVQGETKTSHVYATGHRGSFVKLRCTYAHDPQTEPQSEDLLRRFLIALGPVLNS